MSVEIRRVAYDHPDAQKLVDRVQEFYVERYGEPDHDPTLPEMFEGLAGAYFLAYLDDVPVASGAWRRSGESALGTVVTAEIKRMYVVPEAQGQGLAKRMLAHVETSAHEAGFEAMVLTTGGLQHEAIGLYAANGYVDVEPFGYYKDDDLVVCMAKRLDG
ncbi:GNAT family N-acetyltransferase [Nocardioides luteus]|uniref:GNAT family N-acetyltransferase n=1 Tax=Nocardioides luteus TaxID=1844 RepID=UPI0018C96F47|nr:GNAT family N-acetyltransferase [Nocardioides luteus]MBG6098709.1 GNAT superfamily N-acetyltransferase [Nocardioides luteus]